MANNENTKELLKKGQEGTTGNDRGMQDQQHDRDKQDDRESQDINVKRNSNSGGVGSRTDGAGDGGSSSQTNAAGSDGSGGKGSIAEGVEGAGGDSKKGAQKMGEN